MGSTVEREPAFGAPFAAVILPPKELPGFPNAKRADPKTPIPGVNCLRSRWKDDGTIYEWDYQHGTVEKYDKRGWHKGEFDAYSGKKLGDEIPTRRVCP